MSDIQGHEPQPNQELSPYRSPQPETTLPSKEGDATGGIIPYKNPPALIAYYLGLFSLFPVLGFFLAVPALVLGIIGLKKRNQNPEVKGSVHAWIGIVMGGMFTIVWGLAMIAIAVALFAGANQ